MRKLLKFIDDIGFVKNGSTDTNIVQYVYHKYGLYNEYKINIFKNGNKDTFYKIMIFDIGIFPASGWKYFNTKEDIQQCIEDLKKQFHIELRKNEINKLLAH